MANPRSRDLFDDTTMTFGEHLEALRIHLWKALIGLVICVIVALFFGNHVVGVVRKPIDDALRRHNVALTDVKDDVGDRGLIDYMRKFFGRGGTPEDSGGNAGPAGPVTPEGTAAETPPTNAGASEGPPAAANAAAPQDAASRKDASSNHANAAPGAAAPGHRDPELVVLKFRKDEFARLLHELYPEQFAAVPQGGDPGRIVEVPVRSSAFARLEKTAEAINRPVTLTVQEAFLTYLKVALVSGLLLSSPWIFYQLWLFVAAGLYPHEQRYVYIYLPLSLGLFVGGAAFCFFLVFPFVLDFLLGFNAWMEIHPQIRLSEWISFALMLPLMFGISFQLPLVMLFMERLSIFEIKDYRQKRRMAILVIAVLSMMLTPSDPWSMMMMMIPLCVLYEVGILMCHWSGPKSPFETQPA